HGGSHGECEAWAAPSPARHDAVRVLKNELFTLILPRRNVNTSQPLTSTLLPSPAVPVKSHSETPRSPETKWRAPAKRASGYVAKTRADAGGRHSRPPWRGPTAAGPSGPAT